MRHLLTTLWWWLRVLVLVVVGLYALALLWNNSKQTASIWYWPGRPVEETNIIALALAAFLSGGLIMTIGWALFTAMVNLRRTRAARKKRAAILLREEMERKASMLRMKPVPAPVVRVKPEPKPVPKPIPKPTEPDPVPIVEPMPEVTSAPAPVVVIKPPPEQSTLSSGALSPAAPIPLADEKTQAFPRADPKPASGTEPRLETPQGPAPTSSH